MGIWGLGLGRERTKLGKFLDRNGITQTKLMKKSGLSEKTLTRICSEKEYSPSGTTRRTVVSTLYKMGFYVNEYDFW